jgi:6-phosphogluconolactonase (cycloisomerase 2 family)
MYSINSSSGQLTALSPSSIETGSLPVSIKTITIGDNSYAYVCNNSGNNVTMYLINSSSGQLTALSQATIGTISPRSISIIGI